MPEPWSDGQKRPRPAGRDSLLNGCAEANRLRHLRDQRRRCIGNLDFDAIVDSEDAVVLHIRADIKRLLENHLHRLYLDDRAVISTKGSNSRDNESRKAYTWSLSDKHSGRAVSSRERTGSCVGKTSGTETVDGLKI